MQFRTPATSRRDTPAKIYDLWEVPCHRASKLRPDILVDLDQKPLMDLLQLTDPLPLDRLVPVVSEGIRRGEIHGFMARMPHNGAHVQLIDRETLPHEYEKFIASLAREHHAGGRHNLMRMARRQLRPTRKKKQAVLNLLRPYTQRLLRHPRLIFWMEKICFRDTTCLLALTMISPFPACQIREEIGPFLSLVQGLRPRNILEIGTCFGGNFYLLCRMADPEATLVTMDLRIPHPELLRSFARKHQRVVPVEGNSADPAALQKIKTLFPEPLDLLFIDGDHSYDGAAADFANYSPLVGENGIVVFHDIVEDNATRYGVDTGGYSAGVPRLWRELRQQYRVREFIRNPLQDGAGIGVLFPGTA